MAVLEKCRGAECEKENSVLGLRVYSGDVDKLIIGHVRYDAAKIRNICGWLNVVSKGLLGADQCLK